VPPYRRAVRTNMRQITPYLQRISAVSLLPTMVLIAGVVAGVVTIVRLARARPSPDDPPDVPGLTIAFAALVVLSTMAGYYWFLTNYTDLNGDTIKASYILQTLPFLALMAAVFLRRLLDRWPRGTAVLLVLLVGVTAHNAPAMITHYPRDSDHACRESPTTAPATATQPAPEEGAGGDDK